VKPTAIALAVRQAVLHMQRENARLNAMRNCCQACREAAKDIR
jgi:hypothetical protein